KGDVATKELPSKLVSGVHHIEAAGSRVDNELARLRGGGDQAFDQSDRLHMRIAATIDLFDPTVRNSVIAPGRARLDQRFLHDQQVVAAAARSRSHAEASIIRADEVDDLEHVGGDAELTPFTQNELIGPSQ